MTQLQHKIVYQINEFHEAHQEAPRYHLGVSTLGHPCERWLWLSFRWAVVEKFEGRILRLFRRGQNEERTIIQDLRNVGYNVTNTQTKVDFGAGVKGSIDGQMMFDGKNHILEFKTHSKKSFDDLEKKGVEESKPLHYVQMQVYMLGCEIDRAFYIAVCKDDDRLYVERIKLNRDFAQKFVEKGRRLALDSRLPPPISDNPTWYECKMCAAHDFCHGSKTIKKTQTSCRTCAHSTNTETGWICERHDNAPIPEQYQAQGCDSHVIHFDLVPYKAKPHPDSEWKAIFIVNGKDVANGEGEYKSGEILANPTLCANPDEQTKMLRRDFGGEIV